MKNAKRFTTQHRAWSVVLLWSALLTGCGFQLRDELQLTDALKHVNVTVADEFSPLARDLPRALERAGAHVEPGEGQGIAQINIPVNTIATDVLSVSQAARVQEFIVRHRIELSVIDADGKPLLSSVPIELAREFSYDESQALGAANEEALIKKELQRDMLRAVLDRLSALNP